MPALILVGYEPEHAAGRIMVQHRSAAARIPETRAVLIGHGDPILVAVREDGCRTIVGRKH